MSDPEQLLRDALQHRADHTPYDATALRDVESGAHRLRRRRRTVVAALTASAAVVVALVPLAVIATRDAGPDPAPAPTMTPSVPAPTTTTSTPPAPTGGLPLIAYAEGGRIHEPGGRVFVPPGDLGVSGFAPYRGGYLVADTRYFEGSVGLTQYDAGGREVASWTSTGRPVSSADGSLVAWSSFVAPESGETGPTLVHLGSSTGSAPEQTQEVDLTFPAVVGLLGEEVVLQDFYAPGVWVTDLESAPRRIEGLDHASDVSSAEGLVAGSKDDRLGRVVEAATGAVLWERRGVDVGAFSPDGRYAVTTRTSGGQREIVEARTGEVVAQVAASREEDFPTLLELTWEDDAHLLGDLVYNCCTHLARVSLDGSVAPARPRGEIGGTGFVFVVTS